MGLDSASDGTWLQRDHTGLTGSHLSLTPPIYVKKGQVCSAILFALIEHSAEKTGTSLGEGGLKIYKSNSLVAEAECVLGGD